MSKQKWMKLLINYQWGSSGSCYYHTDRRAAFVIHENFKPVDLRDYYREYGEEEFPKAQQKELRKTHPKQADEKFLCVACYREYQNNPTKYDPETGHSDFTSIEIERWRKKDYKTVEDAVREHLIVRKD